MQKFFKELISYTTWPMIAVFAYWGLIEGYEPAKNIALFAGYFLSGVVILLSSLMVMYYSSKHSEVSIGKLQNTMKKNELGYVVQTLGVVIFSTLCVIKGYFLLPALATVSVFLVKLMNVFASERLEIELAKQNNTTTETVNNLAN